MQCRRCGAQLNPGSAYCSQCGEPVVPPVEAPELDETRAFVAHSTAPQPVVTTPGEDPSVGRTIRQRPIAEAPLPIVPNAHEVKSAHDVREVRSIHVPQDEPEPPRSTLVPILVGVVALLVLVIVGIIVVNPGVVGLGGANAGGEQTVATGDAAAPDAAAPADAATGEAASVAEGEVEASDQEPATPEPATPEPAEPEAAEAEPAEPAAEAEPAEDDKLEQTATPVFSVAEASSSLPADQYASYYGPYNAIDGDLSTAWNEGASGSGVGEWLRLSANTPQVVAGIRIQSGYPLNKGVYAANNRPQRMSIALSDGYSTSVTLDDTAGVWQTITFDTLHKTDSITMTIDSVYEGKTWQDAAIGEIEVF